MERVVGEPTLKTGERVQLQRPAVDDGQLALYVTLEVVDGYAERLGCLLLVEGQAGHLATEALAGSVTFESTRAHRNQISKDRLLENG
jgi:hypothetical protein